MQSERRVLSQKMDAYCWSTPKYRSWCAQHASFEGNKAEETCPRKSSLRTLKEVGQQYPSVFCDNTFCLHCGVGVLTAGRVGDIRSPFRALRHREEGAYDERTAVLVPRKALRLGLRPARYLARLGRARGFLRAVTRRRLRPSTLAPPRGVHRIHGCPVWPAPRGLLYQGRAAQVAVGSALKAPRGSLTDEEQVVSRLTTGYGWAASCAQRKRGNAYLFPHLLNLRADRL
jgi:hypothetical protein